MDRSKVREIVNRHAQMLMERLGLPHWTIDFYYDLRLSNDTRTVKGRCTRHVDYNNAVIELDPDAFDDDDEAALLKIIRHELFHVVLSPFDLFRQFASHLWEDDSVKVAVMDRAWDHAVEQAVINLERMHHELTERPSEVAAVKKKKPKSKPVEVVTATTPHPPQKKIPGTTKKSPPTKAVKRMLKKTQ